MKYAEACDGAAATGKGQNIAAGADAGRVDLNQGAIAIAGLRGAIHDDRLV